jgi:hypothetical protein
VEQQRLSETVYKTPQKIKLNLNSAQSPSLLDTQNLIKTEMQKIKIKQQRKAHMGG